jgi:hypothetical protein
MRPLALLRVKRGPHCCSGLAERRGVAAVWWGGAKGRQPHHRRPASSLLHACGPGLKNAMQRDARRNEYPPYTQKSTIHAKLTRRAEATWGRRGVVGVSSCACGLRKFDDHAQLDTTFSRRPLRAQHSGMHARRLPWDTTDRPTMTGTTIHRHTLQR